MILHIRVSKKTKRAFGALAELTEFPRDVLLEELVRFYVKDTKFKDLLED
jgi:uncharacterized protein (UPF0297 family)